MDRSSLETSSIRGKGFVKRLLHECQFLGCSLPPDQTFVQTYFPRVDFFRALIVGLVDLPYEHAPFSRDSHFARLPH